MAALFGRGLGGGAHLRLGLAASLLLRAQPAASPALGSLCPAGSGTRAFTTLFVPGPPVPQSGPVMSSPARLFSSTARALRAKSQATTRGPPNPTRAAAAASPRASPPVPPARSPPTPPAARYVPTRPGGSAAGPAAVRLPASRAARPASAAQSASAGTRSGGGGGGGGSLAEQLGRRAVATLLYEAPSHFWFRTMTLAGGAFCLAYTVLNYWSIAVNPPPGLMDWVSMTFSVVCAVMAGIGVYLLLGGRRIIRSIHAMPAARIRALAGKGAAEKAAQAAKAAATDASPAGATTATTASTAKTAAAASAPPPIYLEVEIARWLPLPFVPSRKVYVVPSAFVVPSRLARYGMTGERAADAAPVAAGVAGGPGAGAGAAAAAGGAPLTGIERVRAYRAEQEAKKRQREYEMSHLMTAPFRHAASGAQSFFRLFQRAFSRDGFIPVYVDGRKMRLDVSGGWALEQGRALDRLVTVKESLA